MSVKYLQGLGYLKLHMGAYGLELKNLQRLQQIPSVRKNKPLQAKIVGYAAAVERDIARVTAQIAKLEILISGVSDDRHRQILYARYIENKKWERIADDMNYDLRYCHRLHKKALEKIGAQPLSVS